MIGFYISRPEVDADYCVKIIDRSRLFIYNQIIKHCAELRYRQFDAYVQYATFDANCRVSRKRGNTMDLRIVKTRNAILSAWETLRAKKPVEKISVKELSELAQIKIGRAHV